MKRFHLLYFVIAGLLIASGCSSGGKKGIEFFISPSGNDIWTGKLPEPNKKGTDGPFATLEKARDAVRALKKTGAEPGDSISIILRGGIYQVGKTLQFTADDSGTENAPVVWKPYAGEAVILSGGKILTGFQPVSDPSVLSRIEKECQDKILQTDLKSQGITNYGEITPDNSRRMELFYKNAYMMIARYPNEGWENIIDVPQSGELGFKGQYNLEKPLIIDGIIAGRHYGRFTYKDDRPSRWKETGDIWMQGYWCWDWSDGYQKIAKIDLLKKEIYPEKPYHGYGYRKGQRYFFLNILEELDSPGEWYLDKNTGILYFWPPSPLNDGDVTFPVLEEMMFSFENTSFLTIQGMTFDCSRTNAVKINGGTRVIIAGCTFRNLGNDAVILENGKENGVISCDIFEVAGGGINLGGGDRKTLTPAGNYSINNHIHHFARVFKTYRPAINISGVGNIIKNTYIHDAPHCGVLFSGNDHLLEFNELTDIALETGDVGAFYTCGDWTYRGNTFRYNYLHHIHGPGNLGCMTIYQDLPGSGATIYGNILYDLDMGFFTNSGRDNIIENNIFIKCNPSVAFNIWRDKQKFYKGGDWQMWEKLQEVNYKEPPYSIKYPELLRLFEDGDPAIPTGNVITRNISWGGKWFRFWDPGLDFTILSIKDNLIADPVILSVREKNKKELTDYTIHDQKIVDEFTKYGNIVIDSDPGFVDAEHGDFNLKEDSPAIKLGFKPIPFDKIGLYIDQYRTTLPEKKAVKQ